MTAPLTAPPRKRPAPPRQASRPSEAANAPRGRTLTWLAMLDRPLASYRLIIGCTGMLLAIGLAMVLSTSSASQLDTGGSPYSVFAKQLIGALVGLPMIWVLSRTPPRVFRAVARPLMWAAILGLVLVLPFGSPVDGAERWISVAGVVIQPSEFAKLALLIWGADLLARKVELKQLRDWRRLLMPLLPGAAVLCLLVMLGDDLGTTFLLLVILLTLLWVLGTPGRLFALMLGLIVFALLMLIVVEPYRATRLTDFLNPGGGPTGPNQQAIQGKYAMGSGGLFGVGIGESKQKWGWVPEPSSDFIFAILGEELGLIGTVCVVFLYGGLAYAGLRVARRMAEPFTRLAAAGITVWIVVQALVNICAVVGLLPITGVPLPLMSQGLSSLLVTMAAIGVLLSLARREPDAAEALAAARPRRQQRPPPAARGPGVREPAARGPGVRGPSQGRHGQGAGRSEV
jgi:cell division protein FtsW